MQPGQLAGGQTHLCTGGDTRPCTRDPTPHPCLSTCRSSVSFTTTFKSRRVCVTVPESHEPSQLINGTGGGRGDLRFTPKRAEAQETRQTRRWHRREWGQARTACSAWGLKPTLAGSVRAARRCGTPAGAGGGHPHAFEGQKRGGPCESGEDTLDGGLDLPHYC